MKSEIQEALAVTPSQESKRCNLTEYEIIEQVLKGDTQLFRLLVDKYKNKIFHIVYKQIGSHTIAEDLCQEIFLKTFKGLSSFRKESQFQTWLIQIALNTTNTYLSSKAHRTQKLEDKEIEVETSTHESPSAHYEQKEKLNAFRNCFAKLGPAFREVVTLCGFEERAYTEAAEILNIPTGTVKSRLNKARLLLKDCLALQLQ